ncbi:MAG: 30S ribosomal protein S15 [Elusimicrobia bacterium]|nr:30S ribosomal protein S15 [Elusimicrobiota bacterium]
MLTKKQKQETVAKYQKAANDTGSSAVQIALLTDRIKYITAHLKANKKDFAGERGMLKLVGQRRRLLRYVKNNEPEKYKKLIQQLEVRK